MQPTTPVSSFRDAEVRYILSRFKAAESCSLIGVGNVGKRNLLQHLSEPEVLARAFGADAAEGRARAIIIDPNLLGPMPPNIPANIPVRCWAGYELLMHRLYFKLYPFTLLEPPDDEKFHKLRVAMQDGTNPLYAYTGLRHLEFGLSLFFKRGLKLVLMFDSFEILLRQMPPKFFQSLRGLRDLHKNQLSFLTFTARPLPDLVAEYDIDPLLIEPFIELFTDNRLIVGPYSDADARDMIVRLMARQEKNYDSYALNFLLWASGRHAGLLRAGFSVLDAMLPITQEDTMFRAYEMADKLALKPPVENELLTIWRSLTADEQAMLRQAAAPEGLAFLAVTGMPVYRQLELKQLIRAHPDGERVEVMPPVLQTIIRRW